MASLMEPFYESTVKNAIIRRLRHSDSTRDS